MDFASIDEFIAKFSIPTPPVLTDMSNSPPQSPAQYHHPMNPTQSQGQPMNPMGQMNQMNQMKPMSPMSPMNSMSPMNPMNPMFQQQQQQQNRPQNPMGQPMNPMNPMNPMVRSSMGFNPGTNIDVTLVPHSNQTVEVPNIDVTLIPGSGYLPQVLQLRLQPKDPQFFPTLTKEVNRPLKVGRRMGPENDNDPGFIAYDTKVISRMHAEIFEQGGKIYLKDAQSKSGTFLNTLRLSAAGVESKPFEIKEGDNIQFGVDFQGGQIRDQKAVVVTVHIIGSAGGASAGGTGSNYNGPKTVLTNLTYVGGVNK